MDIKAKNQNMSVKAFWKPSLALQLWRLCLRRSYPILASTRAPNPAEGEGEEAAAPAGGQSSELVLAQREWRKSSRRTGLVAIKLGMTQLWDREGLPIAVTVLQVGFMRAQQLYKFPACFHSNVPLQQSVNIFVKASFEVF